MGIKIKRSWWRALFAHRTQTPVRRLIRSTTLVGIAAVLAIPVGIWQVLDLSPRAVADTPVISSVTPSSGSVAGGETVTISGSNIGSKFTRVVNGGDHSCGLTTIGTMFCWGDNSHGQLGNNSTTDSLVPVAVMTSGVLNGKAVTDIAVGLNYSCAVADGAAYCWGDNTDGQLGDGTTIERHVPTAVKADGVLASKTVTDIDTAITRYTLFGIYYATCAVADGAAYCWGDNSHGQLGNNSTTDSLVPVAVTTSGVLNGKTVTAISVGAAHTCVIADDGAYCWGYNQAGRLGNSSTTDSSVPVAVTTSGVLNGKTVTAISAGEDFSCAVADGAAYCWGMGTYGQLGNGATGNTSSPVAVTTSGILNGKTITDIDAGIYGACVIADGIIACWGYNSSGEVGDGTKDTRTSPVAVIAIGTLTGKTITGVSMSGTMTIPTGVYTTCTVANGDIYCWGDNSTGQFGNGTTTSSLYPAAANATPLIPTVRFNSLTSPAVEVIDNDTIRAIAPAHTQGPVDITLLYSNSSTITYPDGYYYGTPPPTITSITPNEGSTAGGTSVTINGSNFIFDHVQKIDMQAVNGCLLTTHHKLYCWGYNGNGELGNGTTTDSHVPVAVDTSGVLAGKTITDFSVGFATVCAIADGKAYCWGGNSSGGQLGIGSSSPSHSTVPMAVDTSGVLAGKTLTQISVAVSHVCVLDTAGKAYCWGGNANGQLGNNSYTSAFYSPVAVSTSGVLAGKTITKISAGGSIVDSSAHGHTCAIADGKAYCWGANENGQLGDGTTIERHAPVAVDGLSGKTVTDISAGVSIDTSAPDDYYAHSCLIADGDVYCWGYNAAGQLGDGTATSRTIPTQINTTNLPNTPQVSVEAGDRHSCALNANHELACWGNNAIGQFGDGTATGSVIPKLIPATGALVGKSLTSIVASYANSCGVADQAAYCWGYNNAGQLGNGTTNASSVPVAVDDSLTSAIPTIQFDGLAATNVNYVSATKLTATTPAHTQGTVAVTVTNVDGQNSTLANSYTYTPPATVPDAPTSLSATPASNGVNLAWQAPSSDGGSALTDYLVEYSDDGGGSWQSFAHPASTATAITVTGLSPGITYQFRVSAVNAVGTSSPSTLASAAQLSISLSAPATVGIAVLPAGMSTISSTASSVAVTTNSPSGYQLFLEAATSNRNLTATGGATITPTTGTLTTPTSLLVNTWGFRVDGVSGFGAGPTVQETNVTTSGFSWAGIPEAGSPVAIHNSGAAVTDDPTTVWYAMKIDNSHPAGTYSTTVLYTAVAG